MNKTGHKAGPWLKNGAALQKIRKNKLLATGNGNAARKTGGTGTFLNSEQKFLNETGRNLGINKKTFNELLRRYHYGGEVRKALVKLRERQPTAARSQEIRVIAEALEKEVNVPMTRAYAFASWIYDAQRLGGYKERAYLARLP